MRIARDDDSRPAKGWYFELAHDALPFIGFANEGVDEQHYHRELCEVYLVARGTSMIVVDGTPITLCPGNVTYTIDGCLIFDNCIKLPPKNG